MSVSESPRTTPDSRLNESVPGGNLAAVAAKSTLDLTTGSIEAPDPPQASAVIPEAPKRTILKAQPPSQPGEEKPKGNVTNSGIPQSSLAPRNGTVTTQWTSGELASMQWPFVDGTEIESKSQSSQIHIVPKETVPEEQKRSVAKERRNMSTKWLGMTFKRQKQDALDGKAGSTQALESGTHMEDEEMDKDQEHASGNGLVKLQGDLQSVEDICRAAGIMNPRMGYSVSKVVAMINSDHMRGLPNEAKGLRYSWRSMRPASQWKMCCATPRCAKTP